MEVLRQMHGVSRVVTVVRCVTVHWLHRVPSAVQKQDSARVCPVLLAECVRCANMAIGIMDLPDVPVRFIIPLLLYSVLKSSKMQTCVENQEAKLMVFNGEVFQSVTVRRTCQWGQCVMCVQVNATVRKALPGLDVTSALHNTYVYQLLDADVSLRFKCMISYDMLVSRAETRFKMRLLSSLGRRRKRGGADYA